MDSRSSSPCSGSSGIDGIFSSFELEERHSCPEVSHHRTWAPQRPHWLPQEHPLPGAGGGRPGFLHIELGRALGLAVRVGRTDRVQPLVLTAHVGDVQGVQTSILPQPQVLALLHLAAWGRTGREC